MRMTLSIIMHQVDGLEEERHVLVRSQVSYAMLKDFLVRILWHYDGHVTSNTAIRDWLDRKSVV